MVIAAGMIDDPGDMDVARGGQFVTDADAGTEASCTERDTTNVFRNAQGCINSNDKRIGITVVYRRECIRQISGMNGMSETAIYGRFFCAVRQGQGGDQLMSHQRSQTVSCCTVRADAQKNNRSVSCLSDHFL